MNIEKLSIFISLILRHKPEEIGITLDDFGWAKVEDLINGINKSGRQVDMNVLEEIVKTDSKQRYSFNEGKTKIRANQGHSIPVKLELKELEPPNTLYHGTATKYIEGIKSQGIKSMSRQYVHLSKDFETAKQVGSRHGKPVILIINAKRMYEDGIKFYLSENGVWLTEYIDPKYILYI